MDAFCRSGVGAHGRALLAPGRARTTQASLPPRLRSPSRHRAPLAPHGKPGKLPGAAQQREALPSRVEQPSPVQEGSCLHGSMLALLLPKCFGEQKGTCALHRHTSGIR